MPQTFKNTDLAQLWLQLRRIADALETQTRLMVPAQEPEPAPTQCQHLEQVEFGNGEWECPTCRHHEPPT